MVLLLALFGMFCWGLAPVFGKLGLSHVNPLAGLVLRTYIAVGLLTLWVIFNGTMEQVKMIPWKAWIFIGIEGVLATLVGDLAYYAAIKYGEVSFVTIVMACSPLVSMMMAVIFLGEEITVFRMLGAIFVIGGLILVAK